MNPATFSRCEELSPVDECTDEWLHVSSGSDSIGHPSGEVGGDHGDSDGRPKLTSKLVSAWNSLKYGWPLKHKSHFSKHSPVTILGQSFQVSQQADRERFRCVFSSFVWLTYRRGFPELGGSSLTTDSGWGCVLRTGQMLLAQSLLLHLLPPGWTWSLGHHGVKDDLDLPTGSSAPTRKRWRGRKMSLGSLLDRRFEATHRRVVSWFADRRAAPFGVHQMVEVGRSSGKKAGDWYGPSIVAHILRKAVHASSDVPDLAVYVAQDCTIYLEDVRTLCQQPHARGSLDGSPPRQSWKSLVVLVPVRLGGQGLNPAYIPCVKKLLTLECCVGIVGGKPRHSLFFVGFQEDYLLYLDPHYCQATVDVTQENFPLESFHCKYPRKMPFHRMDPSCTVGFYAKDQKDFESMCSAVSGALASSAQPYPMFIFSEGPGHEESGGHAPTNVAAAATTTSSDEFVLL